ncbi:metabotropic glutamate receptor 8-like isoform X2 [Brevipalpus obovatus]|uniref:metabotropic glutamate receptor 8-like isoform X2 n=1 Tax=Brevipalpus obovatus TaxID=246614 RepID=UPI003D9F5D1E
MKLNTMDHSHFISISLLLFLTFSATIPPIHSSRTKLSDPLQYSEKLSKEPIFPSSFNFLKLDQIVDIHNPSAKIPLKQLKIHAKRSIFTVSDSGYGANPTSVYRYSTPKHNKPEAREVKLPGDIIIGGLFPMHDSGNETHHCGAIKEGKGIQRMEAMLFALDRINSDPNILPNITLGAHILDTCSRDTYALEQTMEFVKSSLTTVDHTKSDYQCNDGSSPKYMATEPIVGVIGAASSSVSVMVANILRLFQIPQISYASTSVELSDKSRFGFFSRVVPPDNFQAQVMVDIVKLFNWTYVSTIMEEGEYGERGIEFFRKLAAESNDTTICIAETAKISRNAKPEDFIKIIKQLYSKDRARAVVMFVDEDNCRKLLNASRHLNMQNHFAWLGSDSWGRKLYPVRQQEDAAHGAITILPKRNALKDFDKYFKNLKPYSNTRNPWFKRFWEQNFNCTLKRLDKSLEANGAQIKSKECSGQEKMTKYEQEGLVPFVVDAVYALAHAIHNLLHDRCQEWTRGSKRPIRWSPNESCIQEPIKSRELLNYIRKVRFIGPQEMEVQFNKDGDAPGRYDIFQYQKRISPNIGNSFRNGSIWNDHDGGDDDDRNEGPLDYDYVQIGSWENKRLIFDQSKLRWPENFQYTVKRSIPISICSPECDRGLIRQIHQGVPCCWHCASCKETERILNRTVCMACPSGYLPDKFKETCVKLPVVFMQWTSPWTIVPAVFASLGIVATIFTLTTFIRFNQTPVIMASGRELCYILLFGLMVCYVVGLLLLTKPTLIICTAIRIGLCLGLCICYSAILTKTNRISRIFNRSVKNGLKRPSYTSPKSQVAICSCLVSVQLVFITAWLIRDPPSVRQISQRIGGQIVAVQQCGISATAIAVSLIYNMILVILCTMYAFKTRKIPDNFNEAKYIVFTMYSTCIVWLAFIPMYFGTNNDFKIQIASLSTCISISAFVNLGCLFTPKLYICLFQPYKNTRHSGSQVTPGTSSSNSTSNALRFTRSTASSGGCAAMIAALTQAVSVHQSAPSIVVPEPSSGDIRTSTTNGDWTSNSHEDEIKIIARQNFIQRTNDKNRPTTQA